DVQEGDALRWLENLDDPELMLPAHDWVFNRKVVTVFVPVNDSAGPSSALLQSAPSITRSKKAWTFPAVWVGDSPCFMRWPNATAADVDAHKSALNHLCCKVTRIGHSSSLVRMWLAEEARSSRPTETWVADNALADWPAGRVSEGTLHLLNLQFNRRGREEHGQFSGEVSNLETAKIAVKERLLRSERRH
ncbi:MAG TPA: type I-U CRISPR-associated protein Csb2, partial [Gemmataceae bacterium]|nr:type I-U CRISPR-associated protein Csb2 [Gemmataceae bacterium]